MNKLTYEEVKTAFYLSEKRGDIHPQELTEDNIDKEILSVCQKINQSDYVMTIYSCGHNPYICVATKELDFILGCWEKSWKNFHKEHKSKVYRNTASPATIQRSKNIYKMAFSSYTSEFKLLEDFADNIIKQETKDCENCVFFDGSVGGLNCVCYECDEKGSDFIRKVKIYNDNM